MLNAGLISGDTAIERWNAELAFRSIVEATADKAGLEFMRHLVKNLAQSLGVAYAFVAEFAGTEDRVKTIAFWSKDATTCSVSFPRTWTSARSASAATSACRCAAPAGRRSATSPPSTRRRCPTIRAA
jgi:hypothetical protein